MSMDWNTGRRFPKLNVEETKGRFKDYVVLVTGGCSGIGKAAVERFASDGATVYALDIRYVHVLTHSVFESKQLQQILSQPHQ